MLSAPATRTPRTTWVLLLLAWTVPGLLQFIQELTYSRVHGIEALSLWHSAALFVPSWLPWILFTPLVARAARRFRPSTKGWPKTLAVHVPLIVGLALVHLVVVGAVHTRWPPPHWPAGWAPELLMSWLQQSLWSFRVQGELLAYGVVVAATLALDARTRGDRHRAASARLEAKLVGAQLEALRGQLRPHFLFNALNSALVLVREDPASAETMLLRISDLLRRSLQPDERTLIPLEEELELLNLYLGVERVRFVDRLQVHVDVPLGVRPLFVPAWLLQPVAENAIRHGIAPLREGGNLWITGELLGHDQSADAQRLRLRVDDDGQGDARSGADGLGLHNTRERLLAAYGPSARLELLPKPGGGTRVEFELPVVRSVEASVE